MQLRISLKRLKVNKIESDGKRLVFSFHPATPVNPELLIGLIRQEPQRYQFTPDHRLLVALPVNASTAETLTTAQEALLKLTA
jgi:transcription-repair coupling factor (superfamily II helicase)